RRCAGRRQRYRSVRRRVVVIRGWTHRIVGIWPRLIGRGRVRRGLLRRWRLRDRPARLIADRCGWPQIIIGKTEMAVVLVEHRDLERKFGTADTGPGDRVDPDNACTFLDRAGFQTRDFGLGPPWCALFGLKQTATATRKRNKDHGADEIQTNSTRHPRNFNEF